MVPDVESWLWKYIFGNFTEYNNFPWVGILILAKNLSDFACLLLETQ